MHLRGFVLAGVVARGLAASGASLVRVELACVHAGLLELVVSAGVVVALLVSWSELVVAWLLLTVATAVVVVLSVVGRAAHGVVLAVLLLLLSVATLLLLLTWTEVALHWLLTPVVFTVGVVVLLLVVLLLVWLLLDIEVASGSVVALTVRSRRLLLMLVEAAVLALIVLLVVVVVDWAVVVVVVLTHAVVEATLRTGSIELLLELTVDLGRTGGARATIAWSGGEVVVATIDHTSRLTLGLLHARLVLLLVVDLGLVGHGGGVIAALGLGLARTEGSVAALVVADVAALVRRVIGADDGRALRPRHVRGLEALLALDNVEFDLLILAHAALRLARVVLRDRRLVNENVLVGVLSIFK